MFFQGRSLLIATKHRKEQVMAPVLERELGVVCRVTDDFDTDRFGTFTGEVERSHTPLETLRRKCEEAMDHFQVDMVVASEGSFGPHPSLFFVPGDDELVMLRDRRNDLEIVGRFVTTETNFGGAEVTTWLEVRQFAIDHGFPSHGMIMRELTSGRMVKGITDWDILQGSFVRFENSQSIRIETDMRACFNPTRMKAIEEATNRFVKNVKSSCPQCQRPGFIVSSYISGLPCAQCGAETRRALAAVSRCQGCGFEQEEKFPEGEKVADPAGCDYCNP